MAHNVDWDQFHNNIAIYMNSIDQMSPLGRWVMNWADVPPNIRVALFRTADDKPVVLSNFGLCAVSLGAPLPPDFFSLPKISETYRQLEQRMRKP